MGYIDRLAERSRESRETILGLFIVMPLLILLTVIMLIDTTNTIHSYEKQPTYVAGRLEKIGAGYQHTVELYVDGNIYVIRKESEYSKRSFGIVGNISQFKLRDRLWPKIGKEARIGYVWIGNKRNVVMLSVDGVEYINQDVAVSDFIGMKKTTRKVGFIVLCSFIVISALIWKKLHPKNAA